MRDLHAAGRGGGPALLLPLLLLGTATATATAPAPAAAEEPPPYDLEQVDGMDRGERGESALTPAARETLARLGFVVVDREFKQVFEAYVDSPLPPFVTADSAWQTYRVILEDALKELEKLQAAELRRFSERLLGRAWEEADERPDALEADLARFAAVGLLLQDPAAEALVPESLRKPTAACVERLRAASGPVDALFLGLPLAGESFRARGFYAGDERLARYFAARRWYGLCHFRLTSEGETVRAVRLALLIDSDETLRGLLARLAAPMDELLGPADDPGVAEYAAAARAATGDDSPSDDDVRARIAAFRTELEKRPAPDVLDLELRTDDPAVRASQGRGFRLLGPRRTPASALFARTTHPAVAGRALPSGLDLFAGGPLACEAGRRALAAAEGEAVATAVAGAAVPPLPASLHGAALELLALLQKPLPETAPAPFRRREWADAQLFTQLGAFAGEVHAFTAHAKEHVTYLSATNDLPGYVSPYPEFFRGLADLAARASRTFARYGTAGADLAAAGARLLAVIPALRRQAARERPTAADREALMGNEGVVERILLGRAMHGGDDTPESRLSFYDTLERLARKAVAGKPLTPAEAKLVALGSLESEPADRRLWSLAALCATLADFAGKQARGEALADHEAFMLCEYGKTLGALHGYGGNSWVNPRDDFPFIAPAATAMAPGGARTLYVGLARPEAIYVILPAAALGVPAEGDRPPRGAAPRITKPFVLLRGAVLGYRELARDRKERVDDATWLDEVKAKRAPPPPAFTRSFRVELGAR